MELPLKEWLRTLLKIANSHDQANPAFRRIRAGLQRELILRKESSLGSKMLWPLPPLGVSVRKNGVRLETRLDPLNQSELKQAEKKGYLRWMARRYGSEFEGVIRVLSADPLGERVRRCDHCGLFFLATRNHRRRHHFCCTDHRRAYGHAHRDPKKQALYMREWRAARRRLGRKA